MKLVTETTFDAAHRLVGYDGKCKQLHGHKWRVVITVNGRSQDADAVGILWDFTKAKQIHDMFDHKTILMDCLDNEELISAIRVACGFDSVILLSKNPTAEFLAENIYNILLHDNPNFLFNVRVYESEKSYAEVGWSR